MENKIRTNHIGLKVADYDKSVAFYEALGAKFLVEWGEGRGRIGLWELSDGTRIELFANGGDEYCANGKWIHFAIEPDDVDAMFDKILELGGKCQSAPATVHLPSRPYPITLRAAFCVGLDGEIIELCKQI